VVIEYGLTAQLRVIQASWLRVYLAALLIIDRSSILSESVRHRDGDPCDYVSGKESSVFEYQNVNFSCSIRLPVSDGLMAIFSWPPRLQISRDKCTSVPQLLKRELAGFVGRIHVFPIAHETTKAQISDIGQLFSSLSLYDSLSSPDFLTSCSYMVSQFCAESVWSVNLPPESWVILDDITIPCNFARSVQVQPSRRLDLAFVVPKAGAFIIQEAIVLLLFWQRLSRSEKKAK
jgi:hypothetical protein